MALPACSNSSRSVIGGGRCDQAARAARCGFRQGVPDIGGKREGRMRGEHRRKSRGSTLARYRPIVPGCRWDPAAAVVGQSFRVAACVPTPCRQRSADTLGTVGKRGVPQVSNRPPTVSSSSAPESMRRLIASATSRTGLPNGSSPARAVVRAVSSRSSYGGDRQRHQAAPDSNGASSARAVDARGSCGSATCQQVAKEPLYSAAIHGASNCLEPADPLEGIQTLRAEALE